VLPDQLVIRTDPPIDICIDPSGFEKGVYFINQLDHGAGANAEFRYIEAAQSRIVIALATTDIAPGKEIFAPYHSE
jgi:hypothetical protein